MSTFQHDKKLQSVCVCGAGGFALGYWASKIAGLPEKAARTNSIEVRSLDALCHTLSVYYPGGCLWGPVAPLLEKVETLLLATRVQRRFPYLF